VEKTLHLSCPEAARLVLLDPQPFEWKELEGDSDERYDASLGVLLPDSTQAGGPGNPYPYFQEVRELFLQTIRTVSYPRWQRLVILGGLAEEFNAIQMVNQGPAIGEFIERSLSALGARAFDAARVTEVQPTMQMETVLELIVTRISLDFTTRRFLECYSEFMKGIEWGPESTTQELASRCAEAERRWYAPFMNRHEFMLDNFLFNYLSRTLFPYGHREIDDKLRIDYVENAVRRQYLLLATHYATVRTLLIGIAAFHGARFGTEQVVKLVQAHSKAFQHSTAYPEKALQVLAANGIKTVDQAVVLSQE
jgi:lysine-N-methylase